MDTFVLGMLVSKNETIDENFIDEKIVVDNADYYFSNVIARASKTMIEDQMSTRLNSSHW